jgi:fibronectin type 3 domain-containing protein
VSGLAHLYRIYRRDAATKADAVAGEVPVEGTSEPKFVDGGIGWGSTYLYRITVVTLAKSAQLGSVQVEGRDSTAVQVKPVDIYPPATPTGLQAVYSGVGQQPFIDLTWTANNEPDLAGYNVYRREEDTQPVKLNADLLKSPAYRDAAVNLGKPYFYSVSAVDVRGNESTRSEEASESTPP